MELSSSAMLLILKIVAIILTALLFDRLGKRFVVKTLKKALVLKDHIIRADEKREETLLTIFSSILSIVVWAFAFLMILPELGIDIKALLTGLGLTGLAIGLGSRKIIEDFIVGLFIIIEDQYRVGDEVEIAGIKGRVIDINLRRTVLKDEAGNIHFVSHGMIKVSSRKREENG
jgi:small conductance mechanosensitive channel